jgi:hypothetical protein
MTSDRSFAPNRFIRRAKRIVLDHGVHGQSAIAAAKDVRAQK